MKVWRFKAPDLAATEGDWWLANSTLSAAQLRLKFKRESVGVALLERVEVIEATSEPNKIRIKLRYPSRPRDQYAVDTCLTELGVGLIDPISTTHHQRR